jgi:hypothetical protein
MIWTHKSTHSLQTYTAGPATSRPTSVSGFRQNEQQAMGVSVAVGTTSSFLMCQGEPYAVRMTLTSCSKLLGLPVRWMDHPSRSVHPVLQHWCMPKDPLVKARDNLIIDGEHWPREAALVWHDNKGADRPYLHRLYSPRRTIQNVRHEITSIAWSLVAIVERMDRLIDLMQDSEHANGRHDQARSASSAHDAKASEVPTSHN